MIKLLFSFLIFSATLSLAIFFWLSIWNITEFFFFIHFYILNVEVTVEVLDRKLLGEIPAVKAAGSHIFW
ncbi:MAG TPA: hypothetical protein DHV88_06535 [Roseburia sp.]|nr:hypothetical protein [Roseburia sp.]